MPAKEIQSKKPICLFRKVFILQQRKLTRKQNNSGTHTGSSVVECRCQFSSFWWKQGTAEKRSGGGGVILMTTPLHRNECFIKKSLNSQISYHTSLPRYLAFGKFTWSCFHWTRKWSAKWYIIFPDNDNVFTRQILSTNTMITSLTPVTWRREITWY